MRGEVNWKNSPDGIRQRPPRWTGICNNPDWFTASRPARASCRRGRGRERASCHDFKRPARWSRFVRITKPYLTSDSRGRALRLLGVLLGLLLAISGLNIVISYVGRDFMSAIAEKKFHDVYLLALAYAAVFGASAAVGAFARFFEMLIGLRWRDWLTQRFLQRYLSSRAYFQLNTQMEVDNPDQRISEDLRTFTSMTLSFLVMATNSAITIVAFTGILWSITPWLLVAVALYPLLARIIHSTVV